MLNDIKKKIVVAVSGGVDSVVLLDKLAKKYPDRLVVAHVDHGIRTDSGQDAEFVRGLAKKYKAEFRLKKLNLDVHASEEVARNGRYEFLWRVADEFSSDIYVAHHGDDVIESVAINISRGTGWRGLAVMNTPGIIRPLTNMFKNEIISYAKKYGLDWHEDSTNATDMYLRNRFRKKLRYMDIDTKLQILALWNTQLYLAGEIDQETKKHITNKRYFYIMTDDLSACAVLRQYFLDKNLKLTIPQLNRLLISIKTARSGSKVDIVGGSQIIVGKTEFTIAL